MLENSDEPHPEIKMTKKTAKSRVPPKPSVRDPKYLWNVPKARRKEILRNRLSPQEFVAIFGRQFEPEFRNEGYLVTIPEPFDFGKARPSRYRKAMIDEMVAERAQDNEIYQFRAKSVPSNVFQPIYRDMLLKEQEKKDDIIRRSSSTCNVRK